ncbi:MAG: SagB/ThcOx family dehydrogenase [Planctomycetota bacterium]
MLVNVLRSACPLIALCIVAFAAAKLSAADIVLPKPNLKGTMSIEEGLARRRSVRQYATGSLTLDQVSQLLWACQGVTNKEGYRAAPSAGATFPIEMYLVVGDVEGVEPGLYHYDILDHALWRTKKEDIRKALDVACLNQHMIADAPATLVITGILQRTAQRYGSRAARYVFMEAGHIGQNIYLQCEPLGLATCAIGAFRDDEVAKVLGLKTEEPLYIFPVGRKPGEK